MKKLSVRILALCLVVAGLFVIVSLFIDGDTEWTNDAQVEQYISPINAKVPGYIKEIRFKEHQFVHQGDTLLLIDDREYLVNVKQAEAALMDARSGRVVVDNTERTASTASSVYDAGIEEARIRIAKLERDTKRFTSLLAENAATPIQVEQYQTELDAARQKLAQLERQKAASRSQVTEVTQRKTNADAAILRAEAAVDMARLNLSYTVVTAPSDGWLGRRTIQEGQLVSPGVTLTTIIPNTNKWIVANFKETQLARIRKGQTVEVTVDAIPGKTFTGRVSDISQATGSKYAIIPTDNSSGNFVKIQQRVPVRIDLDELSAEDNERMSAGMMCEVKVKVKSE